MVQAYKEQMRETNFGSKIFSLQEEIEHLRSLLPADIDNEFLESVGSELNTSKGNNIDWRNLQKSELFEAVRVNQYTEKQNVIVGNEVDLASITVEKQVEGVVKKQTLVQGNSTDHGSKPRLTFDEVKVGLNQFVVSEIFRQYAPAINPDGKEKRADQLSAGFEYVSWHF